MTQQPLPWPAFPLDHVPREENQSDTLYLITGSSGTGKTTWCQQWVMAAQASSWRVGGLLSRPVIEGGEKVAIDLVDLTSGTRRPLAYLRQTIPNLDGAVFGKWWFDTAVLAWGNTVLQAVTAVDLLIIDELGPLEFAQGRGLQAAFALVDTRCYRTAGVVIRPSLLPQAQQRWPWAQVLPITRERCS